MSLDAIITLGILMAFLATALSGRLAVDFALAAAMTALMLFGVLSLPAALLRHGSGNAFVELDFVAEFEYAFVTSFVQPLGCCLAGELHGTCGGFGEGTL